MNDSALLTFTSHIAGKNAKVRVFHDRIEWTQQGRLNMAGLIFTLGLIWLVPGWRRVGAGTEMIPMRQVTSVATRREGIKTLVSIITSGNTIDMRVSGGEADRIRSTIQQQLL